MIMNNKDLYFIAVKVFLIDDNNKLLITKDKFGCWDLPGGRLRQQDFDVNLEKIVERKMIEELGSEIKYQLGQPVVFMRHQRQEILSDGHKEPRRIFAVGYQAQYQSGEIQLGGNHELYEWVDIKNFKPEIKFEGGWLQGIKDFQNSYVK